MKQQRNTGTKIEDQMWQFLLRHSQILVCIVDLFCAYNISIPENI